MAYSPAGWVWTQCLSAPTQLISAQIGRVYSMPGLEPAALLRHGPDESERHRWYDNLGIKVDFKD